MNDKLTMEVMAVADLPSAVTIFTAFCTVRTVAHHIMLQCLNEKKGTKRKYSMTKI